MDVLVMEGLLYLAIVLWLLGTYYREQYRQAQVARRQWLHKIGRE